MFKILIWILLDVSTFAYGTYKVVFALLNQDAYLIHEEAGTGAFLIVLGLLIRNWRQSYFLNKNDDPDNGKGDKAAAPPKTINVLMIALIIFSVLLLNRNLNLKADTAEPSQIPLFQLPQNPVFTPPISPSF